jgi:predicted dehydrogenase
MESHTNKTFRTGIIGCGTIFPMHAQSIRNIKEAKLVAVCDIKGNRAKEKAKKYGCNHYTDYKKMFARERLDAVHICTPHYLHMPMIIEAARQKVNILSEKPMGLDPDQAAKEIAAAKKNKVTFSVIFQNRFNPGSQLVKQRIDDKSLGKLKAAKLVLTYHKPDSYYKKSDWKGRLDKEGGGVVIDQAIHYLDVVRWLIPSEIDYVEANVSSRMHSFIDVEDSAEGVVVFKNGFYLCFYLINCYSFDDDPTIEIDCEKGRVKIVKDSAFINYYTGPSEKAEPRHDEYIDYGDGVKDYWGYCHFNQIKDFYRSLSQAKKPQVSAEDAFETQRLVWAIYESSRRRKRVYL